MLRTLKDIIWNGEEPFIIVDFNVYKKWKWLIVMMIFFNRGSVNCEIFRKEFKFYKDYPFIESIDTSNPIMAALEGTKYTDGQHPKPKLNMNEVQTWPIGKVDVDLVNYNVILFRDINNL